MKASSVLCLGCFSGSAVARLLAAGTNEQNSAFSAPVGCDHGWFARTLGLVLARQLARRGAKLTLLARDAAELKRAQEPLANSGAEVLAVSCDVRRQEEVNSAINASVARFGTVDVLINMRRAGYGRIVNIASVGGKIAVPHLVPYCASKFALVGLSDGLRVELRQENILITTVCPGLMRTGSPRNALATGL
jgi:short-subunit dehydrogenase